MKKSKLIYVISLASLAFQVNISTVDNVITFFIKKENNNNNEIDTIDDRPVEIISEKLRQPSSVFGSARDRLFLESNGARGIHATYLGYMTASNKNGQISFPLKQQSDQIFILVTPKIKPMFMIAPTLIHSWEIDPSQPAAMYEINRKRDLALNQYYFHIKKLPISNNSIPLNTIILLTQPENIIIPLGVTLNHYSLNFILPNLTAKDLGKTENSLYTLSIKQYFEQINIESKNNAPEVATIITNQ